MDYREQRAPRLVIIGDGAQLEPIGAGAPFLQMIKSGLFPVVHLKGQHRSGCGIVEACQAINRGEFPENNSTFQFVERDDEEKFECLEEGLKNKDHSETQIVTHRTMNGMRSIGGIETARGMPAIKSIWASGFAAIETFV
jgi:ATP-dependent exoDNAse (exonuclease V) alpha subunit